MIVGPRCAACGRPEWMLGRGGFIRLKIYSYELVCVYCVLSWPDPTAAEERREVLDEIADRLDRICAPIVVLGDFEFRILPPIRYTEPHSWPTL